MGGAADPPASDQHPIGRELQPRSPNGGSVELREAGARARVSGAATPGLQPESLAPAARFPFSGKLHVLEAR